MAYTYSKIISEITPKAYPQGAGGFAMDAKAAAHPGITNTLSKFGISWDSVGMLRAMKEVNSEIELENKARYGFDAAPTLLSTATISTPQQFLQAIMPDVVEYITQARVADELFGRTIFGEWRDNSIIVPGIELTGIARMYGDKTNLNLASWNPFFEERHIVRFEQDLEVDRLEEERAAAMRFNSIAIKRDAVSISLAVALNYVAFYGFNNGRNQTYGLFNDPALLPYRTVPGGQTLMEMDYDEQSQFFIGLISQLRSQTGTNIDPRNAEMTLAIAANAYDALWRQNTQGNRTVFQFLAENFPNLRIIPVPEMNDANGGVGVAYLWAERIGNTKTMNQVIQTVIRFIGMERKAKGIRESYSNATAGMIVKLPIAVVRVTGVS